MSEKKVPDEHWRDFLDPPEYVAAFQLRGKDAVVTITRVERVTVKFIGGAKRKAAVYIVGKEFPLVFGAEVLDVISGLYGSAPARWIGKRITIFATTTPVGKRPAVECIRVRNAIPPANAKELVIPPPAPASKEYAPTPAESLADEGGTNEPA